MGSIVDIGRGLQRYGLRVGQHPEFGAVGGHAPNSYHYHGEAIDATDWRADNGPEHEGGPNLNWKERTRRLKDRARQLGGFNEVLGPGDAGHDEHLHLALRGKHGNWGEAQLEFLATGRWKQSDGSYSFSAPGAGPMAGGTGTLAAASTPSETAEVIEPAAPDWREAASAADRNTDPSSAGYWQREDMKQWAAAHPELAKQAMARSGVSFEAAATPQVAQPQVAQPQAQAPNRGALNGNQVGGPPPAGAKPLGQAQLQQHASTAQTLAKGWSDWSTQNRNGTQPVDTTDAWSQWRQKGQQQLPSLIQHL
jgi:hypothetical protein